MKHNSLCRFLVPLLNAATLLMPLIAHAASIPAPADAPSPVHLSPLPLNTGGTTPWNFNPAWFGLLAVGLPALLWIGLAWKQALEDDQHRLRRAGSRELQRLLVRIRGAGRAPGSADLHAWCQAVARSWGVRAATPTGSQVSGSLSALEADTGKRTRWQELWRTAERCLYDKRGNLPPDWISDTTTAANDLRIPPREYWLPARLRHWLPPMAAVGWTCAILTIAHAPSQAANIASPTLDAKATAILSAAQDPAARALHFDWNNWAAHYNVGAEQIIQGNIDYAVAHLTAAFLQHPSSSVVQDNLRWSLQQAGVMNPTLRRILYGAWFQRYPVLMSPAQWQRLALVGALIVGIALCALVLQLYSPGFRDTLRSVGRYAAVSGTILLVVSIMAWNGWGELHHTNAAMLVEAINLNPAPTDLVRDRETIPVNAGSVALSESVFLGWKYVQLMGVPGNITGWSRSNYVMPLYAYP